MGDIVSPNEFFSDTQVAEVPEQPGAKVVSPQEFFGETDSKPAVQVQPVPEIHKDTFIQKLGDDLYNGLLDHGLAIAGGVEGSVASVNDLIGKIGADLIPGYRETFVEPGMKQAQAAAELTSQGGTFSDMYYNTIRSLSSLPVALTVDNLLGGLVKIALAGRVLPAVEAVISRIPDFAVGMGVEGLISGEGVVDKATKAGEGVVMGTLYSRMGIGAKGMAKMGTLSVAQQIYESAKKGMVPSGEDLGKAFGEGAMMGLAFTLVPAFRQATKIGAEKIALGKYEKQIKTVKTVEGARKIAQDIFDDPNIRPETKDAFAQPFLELLERRGDIVPPEFQFASWKDPHRISLGLTTMERNLERIAPKTEVAAAKGFLSDVVKENETYHANWLSDNRVQLRSRMKEWGWKPNSIEDKLTQRYGEGRMTLEELKAASPNWEKITSASSWFREKYDSFLDTINAVRKNYNYPEIQKRADYFRHFQELTAASEMFGFLLGEERPTKVVDGIIRKPKPGKPFTPVELERMGGKFTESAIGGFDNYLRVAGNQIFHTDSVQRARALDKIIRMQIEAGDEINLTHFITNLRDYTDILAGQKINLDRSIEDFAGPGLWRFYRFLQKRTASNMVGYNLKTAAYNTIPLMTQAPATMGKINWLRGIYHSALTPFGKSAFEIDGIESDFFTRRYPERKVAMNWLEKGGDIGQNIALGVDQFSVKAILSGKYFELKASGMEQHQAMKEASDYTARMVADRSKGQLPVAMESGALKLFTLFQTEVQNQYSWAIQDVPQEARGSFTKTFSALTQYAVYCWIFNNISEEVTGTRPLFDPLYGLMAVLGANKSGKYRGLGERTLEAAQELISQLPFGNINPLTGRETGRYPVTAAFPDPRKLGKQPIAELSKTMLYFALPYGGGQIKKTAEGISDFVKGYSAMPSGDPRYGVEKDFRNFIQGSAFGKNAFPEAVRYWSTPKELRD